MGKNKNLDMKKLNKSQTVAFRTNEAETKYVELSAQKNGMTKSQFIRAKVFSND